MRKAFYCIFFLTAEELISTGAASPEVKKAIGTSRDSRSSIPSGLVFQVSSFSPNPISVFWNSP